MVLRPAMRPSVGPPRPARRGAVGSQASGGVPGHRTGWSAPLSDDFSQSLGTDFYQLEDRLTDEERALRDKVRAFTDAEIIPVINQYWEAAQFPFDLVPKLAGLGISGYTIEGYGCPGMSRLAAGLVSAEVARGDGSINTFLGVHSGLAMGIDRDARQRGAAAALAAADGAAGQGRRVRPDRAGARLGLRRAGDQRSAGRRQLGPQR